MDIASLLDNYDPEHSYDDIEIIRQKLKDDVVASDIVGVSSNYYRGNSEVHNSFQTKIERIQEEEQTNDEELKNRMDEMQKRLADMVEFEVEQEKSRSGMYVKSVDEMNANIAKIIATYVLDKEIADFFRGGPKPIENVGSLSNAIKAKLELNAEENVKAYKDSLDGIMEEVEDLKEMMMHYREGLEENDRTKEGPLSERLGLNSAEVLEKFQNNKFSQTPLKSEIMLCNIRGPKKDENGKVTELGVTISTSILEEAIQEDRNDIFDRSKDYVIVKGENMNIIVTKEENDKIMGLCKEEKENAPKKVKNEPNRITVEEGKTPDFF